MRKTTLCAADAFLSFLFAYILPTREHEKSLNFFAYQANDKDDDDDDVNVTSKKDLKQFYHSRSFQKYASIKTYKN